jgi:hypothetical protein
MAGASFARHIDRHQLFDQIFNEPVGRMTRKSDVGASVRAIRNPQKVSGHAVIPSNCIQFAPDQHQGMIDVRRALQQIM